MCDYVYQPYGEAPLHCACRNRYITARTINLLLRACPESAHELIYSGLPLHSLCEKPYEEKDADQMNDVVAMVILRLLLEAHPDSVSTPTDEEDEDGDLPLHIAASNKSQAFCKILVDAYPESVRRENSFGYLPIHYACYNGRPDTLEYLFRLYPKSLTMRVNGKLPIHEAANRPGKNTAGIIKFLLRHDPDCVKKTIVSEFRGDYHCQGNGALPLHIVCSTWDDSNITELLFGLYPEAILIRNRRGQLPIDVLRKSASDRRNRNEYHVRATELILFLSSQMNYAYEAQNETAMRTPDSKGSLPLHNALLDRAPLGTIKLLVKGNPEAVNVPDVSGFYPLDIACQFSPLGVVKYLAELSPDRLSTCDVNKNFPLHHACRGGNCEVISYLLETPMSSASVSERNVDDMIPIHLFCDYVNEQEEEEEDTSENDPTEYAEIIWRLLTAYPETILNW